jgi:N-acetylmuramic acid 6-phosphate etherase
MSITESPSPYRKLEKQSILALLEAINQEDKTVPHAVEKAIPQIAKLVKAVVRKMKNGGRLFYIGAGTSGRLGIVDASEIPPTYGLPHGRVIGLIAGGDQAIRKAVEFAEDDEQQAWKDLKKYRINQKDIVIGLAASGRTPYVVGGLRMARKHGITTGCITCNPNTEVARHANYPVEVIVGPEVVTGSTRMKSGTAQKLVLNMISTTAMIKLGRVKDNRMVDMQLTNNKLVRRGTRMIMDELGVPEQQAEKLLKKYKSVRKVLALWKSK